MIMPSDDNEWSELRNKIIGLGERSQKKSYYPELKKRFSELEKFKVLLDSSNDFIFLIEIPEGIITDVNGIVCETLKYKRREVIGSGINSFFSKEAWDYIEKFTNSFSGAPDRNSFNAYIKRKDSFEIPVEITFSSAVFKEQNYVIIAARDISERIKTEEALRNSELNMRTVFNSSRDAIIIHDEKGNILEVNDPMIKLYQIDRLSFQNYTVRDLSARKDLYFDITPEFITKALAGNDQLFIWEAIKPETKQEFLAEVFLRKIIWYGKEMILANVRDITEKKKIEDALTESEEKYRILFEKMLDAFCVCEGIYDENGKFIDIRILDVNPAYEKMYNLKKSDIRGKCISEFVKRQDEYWFNIYENVLRTGESIVAENYSTSWDKYFSVCVFKYKLNQFAIVIEDITDRKKSELIIDNQMKDLEAKNTEMEQFTYTVSHDLRSPLITIKGFAGAVLEDVSNERYDRIKPDIKRIENAAERMQALLEDLLELSRIGRIANSPTEFSMKKLGYEVKELLHGIIEKNGIDFQINELLPNAYGDIQRIREVIQNLVENAVKFMNKEQAKIIEFGFKEEEKEVVFFIRDNGPGISEKYHEKIFGLFNKLNVKSEGTGIGLAIVKRIIELHGGKIWVESAPNEGSTFFFTLKHKPENI